MKTEHTPGPWAQALRKTKGGYSTEVFNEETCKTICTLEWYPRPPVKVLIDGVVKNEIGTYREANAKLIAAAPELLQVAFKCLEWCNGMQSPDFVNQLRIEAETAIKKATK